MSGELVVFHGAALGPIIRAIDEVRDLTGETPIIIGGLAVLCRVSSPHRATTDLDVVDRDPPSNRHLEILRAAPSAEAEGSSSVLLTTPSGVVKVDVLEIRQIEIDEPSDDPGDRLHARSHAWAAETASPLSIVIGDSGGEFHTSALVAEPGPLVAMKLQALMDRGGSKQGSDLLDIVRLVLDRVAGTTASTQIGSCDQSLAADIATHVRLWLVDRAPTALRRIHEVGGTDVTEDDVMLVSELLLAAADAAR